MPTSLTHSLQKPALRALMRLPVPIIRYLAGPRRDGERLDPRVQLLLRLAPRKDVAGTDPDTIARERAETDEQGGWLSPQPDNLVAVQDLTLAGAAGARPARIYRPATLTAPSPALLYFRGGGHVIGSITSHDGLCRTLADCAGIIVISYDYRMAPEHPFPAGIEDCIAAFRGLVRIAADLGIDPDRIAVGGDSAGANCAAVVAQACRADKPRPAGQLLYVPWVELLDHFPSYYQFGDGFMLDKARMDWFTNTYLNGADPTDPRASPLRGDLGGLPPALIWTAGCDPLRDEGEAYAKALSRAGTEVRHEQLPGLIHQFAMLGRVVPAARDAIERSAKMLARTLRQEDPT